MLTKGLKALLAEGKISAELWEWSDALRFLRNIGAHPSNDRISRDDAEDAFNLLQAILETLYHLRPKFEQMKVRRGMHNQENGDNMIEIINIVVTIRVPAAECDSHIARIRGNIEQVISVPASLTRKTVERWPTGTTDPNWPQIKVEYMK